MKTKSYVIATLIWATTFMITYTANAQNANEKKAYQLGQEAIELMDKGNLEASMELLKKAQQLDSSNINYPYELALAHYLNKEYSETITLLNKISHSKDANANVYQLLGNAYDLAGNPEKALSIYREGMEKFPASGNFYLESGNIEMAREEYNKAIEYWERGIKIAPNYPSNYYWLARTFAHSEELIWSLFYAEMFINLEPNSKRTKEISQLLLENYQNSYSVESDSSGQFNLTKRGFHLNMDDKAVLKRAKKGILPFEGCYSGIFAASSSWSFHAGIAIPSIVQTRTQLIHNWFNNKSFYKTYPNKLLSYQKMLLEQGHFEAYTYWLLSEGDAAVFEQWKKEHPEKFNAFVTYFKSNRLQMEQSDKYSRRDY